VTPENREALQKLRKRIGFSMTIPALANDMIASGIAKHKEK
jgi:hypothetical protein